MIITSMTRFVPSSYQVDVDHTPLSGFTFTQFRTAIKGSISFIGASQTTTIQLSSAVHATQTLTTEGSYEFENVLPGKYRVVILQDHWCWRSKSIDVEVVDAAVDGVVFEQLGFFFTVTTSHEVDLTYSVNEGQSTGVLHLKAGSSKHCLEHGGKYTFATQSCHIFEPQTVEWNTDDQSSVTLTAVKHAIGLVVESEEMVGDLQVAARSSNGDVVQLVMDSVKDVSSGSNFE